MRVRLCHASAAFSFTIAGGFVLGYLIKTTNESKRRIKVRREVYIDARVEFAIDEAKRLGKLPKDFKGYKGYMGKDPDESAPPGGDVTG